ncbi:MULTISPECIES: sensor histidine kinase [Bacillus]|uniref:histidine kinase n=1 Tax=Bacillus toyonensis TaxID=155322 RepID=A0A2B6NTC9_9BACI|nr:MULTISPECIES: sensor histidine kinase [Bacillus]AFU16011.1 Two-component sensor kinase yocF [Bacillus thuringiensis MC28]EEL20142.1 Two-component sensor kinase yocF [Bacillus cereus Rock1-3]EEL37628.1 Two-component sensor kinase yocF [Bacillus cereus Rock3-29]EEL58813.1 Methionine aminopeptidase [Bacillus cereus Rock4-18]EOP16874.1 two-component sensor kinase YocF [Bacillus cereus VD131]KAB0445014.1 sensor histidine kinase [Lysinibacillus sp. VIA-II-2016]KXY17340.1 histidine kinase [Bacil
MIEKKRMEIFPKHMGFFPYMWLVYLLFPIYNLTQVSGWKLVMGIGMLIVFIITYRQLYFVQKTFVLWAFIQMILTFLFAIFYNPFMIFFGFFTASAMGFAPSKKVFRVLLCLLVVMLGAFVFVNMNQLTPANLVNIVPMFILMLLTPFGMRNFNQKKMLKNQLNEANEQIKDLVKREERQRIARDLHDTLGHTLSLITLKSQLVEKLIVKNPERASVEAKEITQTSRTALKQLRELISDMRMITVEEELEQIKAILQAANIELEIEQEASASSLSPIEQNILGMCLREAVTNVVKHSKATQCTVSVLESQGELILKVEDNGIGLEDQNNDGNGIRGMKERIALIDGFVELNTIHSGTLLTVKVPVVIRTGKDEVRV